MEHGKRIAFTVAAAGLAVVLGLGFLYRAAIRDHLEAWRFQLTTETVMITPRSVPPWNSRSPWSSHPNLDARDIMYLLADRSTLPVVVDPGQVQVNFVNRGYDLATVLRDLKESGFRVVEQRFPRRAYVLIGEGRNEVEPDPTFPSPGILLPPLLEEPVELDPTQELLREESNP